MILGLSTYFNGIYMKRLTFGALCALSLVACGGQNHDAAPANEPAAAPPQALSSGIDTANFDQSVRPQDDLFRYVNGHWLDTTEIPADKSNYGAFSALADQAEKDLRAIIEESADKADKTDGSNEQKVGDLYDSFMDEAALEAKGAEPLKDELAAIDSIDDKAQLPAAFAQLSKLGVRTPMGFYINQDAKDSTQYIAWFAQTGLGLPDRDYYLSDDAKFVTIREAYVSHMSTMLSGIGIDDAQGLAVEREVLVDEGLGKIGCVSGEQMPLQVASDLRHRGVGDQFGHAFIGGRLHHDDAIAVDTGDVEVAGPIQPRRQLGELGDFIGVVGLVVVP